MITIPTPVDPAFSPPITTANEDALNTQAEAFVSNLGRIIGQRGTEVSTQMTTTAVDFSQLVAEPLRTNGATFLAAAEAASEGAAHGSEVTAQLATAVTTFKQEISRLVNEWNAAAPLFGASPPTPENVAAAKQALLGVLNPQATAAHEALLTAADTANGMLTSGPTPANLQALAAGAGGGSWLMFNLFGAQAGQPPVTGADGAALAGMIRDHLENGTPLTPEMFDVLRSIGTHAQDLQVAGSGFLSPEQLAYLEELFRGLDRPWDASAPNVLPGQGGSALYDLPEILGASGIPTTQQSVMLGAVGGGLLALSNHTLGGSQARLPESLQGLIGRYIGNGGVPAVDPVKQLDALAAMLGATLDKGVGLDQLEGGEELSMALTMAVADANDIRTSPDSLIPFDPLDPGRVGFGNEARVDLIEVATRNTEANAQLLTGGIVHPGYGSDTPEYLVRNILGYDWHDDGKAAAGLINWITDPDLPEEYRGLATESAYNLFTLSTNQATSADAENPGRWDVSTYDLLTDGFGHMPVYDEQGNPAGAFEAAPVGFANPAIAQSMARTAVAYLDHFDDPATGKSDSVILSASGPGATGMYFDMDTRQGFFELTMGNAEARDFLGAAIYGRMISEATDAPFWGPPGTDPFEESLELTRHSAESVGIRDGILAQLLEHGYTQYLSDAQIDMEEGTKVDNQQAAWFRAGAAAVKEFVSELPGVRSLGDARRTFVKELLEAPKWLPGPAQAHGLLWGGGDSPTVEDDPSAVLEHERVKLGTAHSLVESLLRDPHSGIDMDEVIATDATGLVVEHDDAGNPVLRSAEELLLTMDPSLGGNEDSVKAREVLEQVIAKSCYPNAGGNLDEFVDKFFERLRN